MTTSPVTSVTDKMLEDLHIYADDNRVLSEELGFLLSERTELKRDALRIDWLASASNQIGNVQLPKEIVMENIHSLRDAIDAAMLVPQE